MLVPLWTPGNGAENPGKAPSPRNSYIGPEAEKRDLKGRRRLARAEPLGL